MKNLFFLFVWLFAAVLARETCGVCRTTYGDATLEQFARIETENPLWTVDAVNWHVYFISATLVKSSTYFGDHERNIQVYELRNAFVLNKNSENEPNGQTYALVLDGNDGDCNFSTTELDALTDGKRYIFKTTSAYTHDLLVNSTPANSLTAAVWSRGIDARAVRLGSGLRAVTMFKCDGDGALRWSQPKESCVGGSTGAQCVSAAEADVLAATGAVTLSNEQVAGIEEYRCRDCPLPPHGTCTDQGCVCRFPMKADCSGPLDACTADDLANYRPCVVGFRLSSVVPGKGGNDQWMLGTRRDVTVSFEAVDAVDYVEIGIAGGLLAFCPDDEVSVDGVVSFGLLERNGAATHVNLLRQRLESESGCLVPGAYHIVARALDSRKQPISEWVRDESETFEVTLGGCETSLDEFGVCDNRAACRGHREPTDGSSNQCTGLGLVCCVPSRNNLNSFQAPLGVFKSREFTAPAGDLIQAYWAMNILLEWDINGASNALLNVVLYEGGRNAFEKNSWSYNEDVQKPKALLKRDVLLHDAAVNVTLSNIEDPAWLPKAGRTYALCLVKVGASDVTARRCVNVEVRFAPCFGDETVTRIGHCLPTTTETEAGKERDPSLCPADTDCFYTPRNANFGFKDMQNSLPDSAHTSTPIMALIISLIVTIFSLL